jgi:hypothetical protein
MEKYSRTRNFSHFAHVSLFSSIIALLFLRSWCVTGASFAISLSAATRATTPHIKIISPHKGQRVPVDSNILVSGISSPAPAADKTITISAVSVLLNDIKPNQNATVTGHRGTSDFSTWKYTILLNMQS